MDLLDDKYLPYEDVQNILYNTSPKQIFAFCAVTPTTRKICRSENFWRNYIGNSQRRYNKLILEIARIGDLELFKQLWMFSDVIYSEPKILMPALEIAILNGMDDIAEYLLYLHKVWLDRNMHNMNVEDDKNMIYKAWKKAMNKENWRLEYLIISLRYHKYPLLLREAVIADDLDTAVNIIKKHWFYINHSDVTEAIALAKSFASYKICKWTADVQGLRFEGAKKNDLFNKIVLKANFTLAVEIINYYKSKKSKKRNPAKANGIRAALKSKSNQSLKFIRDIYNGSPLLLRYYDIEHNIGNKDVLYEMISGEPRRYQYSVLLASYMTFRPHEYIDVILKYLRCVIESDKNTIISNMLKIGEFYRAKLFSENIPICGDGEDTSVYQDEIQITNKDKLLKLDRMIHNIDELEI